MKRKLLRTAQVAALALALVGAYALVGASSNAFPGGGPPPAAALSMEQGAGKVLAVSTGGSRTSPLAPAGTAFTYQGQLRDGGQPANGQYDFVFTLYDAPTGGIIVSTPVTITNQTVTNGLFTVPLDYGQAAFDGNARYLEIAVRPSGGGAYTTLSPRQALTPTPYALFALKTQGYANVVVVAKGGGDYTSVQAALNSITANGSSNRYLVYVAPGAYTETVTMKPYVDIEGSGEDTTKITYTGSGALNTGTVVGASNSELRFLTVENTGGANNATAIYNSGASASPSLLHITATASGGIDSYGVYNTSASPNMSNVTAKAAGGSNTINYGVYNTSSSGGMSNVTATASGGISSFNYGVYNYTSSPSMNNVTATASGGAGSNDLGVYNFFSSSPTMNNVTATASGGNNNYGLYSDASSPTLNNMKVTGSGSGGVNYGVLATGSGTITINNSTITGSTNTIFNPSSTVRVGASKLDGGPTAGAVTCAGVYDENYTFYPSTCP